MAAIGAPSLTAGHRREGDYRADDRTSHERRCTSEGASWIVDVDVDVDVDVVLLE